MFSEFIRKHGRKFVCVSMSVYVRDWDNTHDEPLTLMVEVHRLFIQDNFTPVLQRPNFTWIVFAMRFDADYDYLLKLQKPTGDEGWLFGIKYECEEKKACPCY